MFFSVHSEQADDDDRSITLVLLQRAALRHVNAKVAPKLVRLEGLSNDTCV